MKSIAVIITLGKEHIHYCKALLESIQYFNPELDVIIIKDGNFNTNFVKKYKNVKVIPSTKFNEKHNLDLYVLLNKLNILFLPELGYIYDYYLHLDADSILTSKIKSEDFDSADFVILQGGEIQRNNDKDYNNLKHYAFNPDDFPEYSFDPKNLYFFSASHIAVKKEILNKFIEYVKKHRFELNKEFINDKRIRFNDQGFLNLMVNYLANIGELNVKVFNKGIYGKQTIKQFPTLTLANVKNKIETEVLFIHYTGPSRKVKMKSHNFGDILDFFLRNYYNSKIIYVIAETTRVINVYYKKYKKKIVNKFKKIF